MRSIAIITGSRADRSPLSSVIKALGKHAQVIKTSGMYGHEQSLLSILRYQRPDIFLCLGDRYETLTSAAIAAHLCIPIAHIHGGEITEGSNDDQFRNAITKLAYWHFPSCKLHANRIIAMGESEDNVFPLGAPGVDLLVQPRFSRMEIGKELGISLKPPVILVCYHPETLSHESIDNQCTKLYLELHAFEAGTVIFSGSNQDIGGDEVNQHIAAMSEQFDNAVYRETFTQKLWNSLMHEADALVGNSSGFVIEGMTLGKIFVNVGERQKGRYDDAVEMFKNDWQTPYPFGKPGTVSQAIADKLLSLEIPGVPRKYGSK